MPGPFRTQLLFAHQPGTPLASALDPLCLQLDIDARAAVHATIGLENDVHLFGEFGIFSAVLARRALAPGIVSTDRHVEYSAHQHNGRLVPVLLDELVSHSLSREKMPTVFFRMSRS